jgi:RND family efflux transporter MFP subunit
MARALRLLLALLVPLAVGGALLGYFLSQHSARDNPEDTRAPRVAQRSGTTLKLGAVLAESYGIKAQPSREVPWQERRAVYGRVVPNPQATAEVRAPFAGTLKAATGQSWPALGSTLKDGQPLAVLEARFTPQERIELQAKADEASARYKGTEESVKIHQERIKRLESVPGTVTRGELDQALVQLAEARSQRAATQALWHVYQQALAALDRRGPGVSLVAPLGGEVAELSARPDTAVEAGQLLIKVVDFRRPLVRLDFPLTLTAPPEIEVTALPGESARHGRLTGAAAQADAGSQRVGYLYEMDAAPSPWRPGLFVTAQVPDAAAPRPAVGVPASALLLHQGRSLVYVQLSPGRFERREVEVLGRDGAALVLGRGVRAGEAVVHAGAQLLLSEEFRRDTDEDD